MNEILIKLLMTKTYYHGKGTFQRISKRAFRHSK